MDDHPLRCNKCGLCPTCGDRILKPGHCYNPYCPDRCKGVVIGKFATTQKI